MIELFFNSLTNAAVMATDPYLLLVVLFGVAWGCIAGAMPGLNSVIAIGVMVPFTFGMEPIYAIAFLVTISMANSFGNSIPASTLSFSTSPACCTPSSKRWLGR